MGPRGRDRSRRPTELEHQRTRVDLRIEHPLTGPPGPDHRGALVDPGADRRGITRREQGLWEDERDAPAGGVDEVGGQREELHGGVGVRSATATAGTAPGRSPCELREERRVADHEVVGALGRPLPAESVPERDLDLGRRGPQQIDRGPIDIDTTQHAAPAEFTNPVTGRSEEPTITAGRVEHRHDPTSGRTSRNELRRQHVGDDDVDELGGCVERTELLAIDAHLVRLRPTDSTNA